eukprot:1894633-Rhodomonas_salina.1
MERVLQTAFFSVFDFGGYLKLLSERLCPAVLLDLGAQYTMRVGADRAPPYARGGGHNMYGLKHYRASHSRRVAARHSSIHYGSTGHRIAGA